MQHKEEEAGLPRGQLSEQWDAACHGNDPHPVTIRSMGTAKEEGRALSHSIHFTFLPGEAACKQALLFGLPVPHSHWQRAKPAG